jgi:spore coat protein CotF
MLIQQMEMMDAALPLLESDNPEIRRMAMEMLTNTNEMTDEMTERMMTMRREFNLRIRDGRN